MTMRPVIRALVLLPGLVAVLLLLAAVATAWLLSMTLPGGDLQARLPGLAAPVSVLIDADGVPRIRAGSEADAAEALGFVHARDRMAQMDLSRRAAAGELSEIAGPATLPLDRMMRTLGLRVRAAADYPALPADTREILQAYARGVNAWIGLRGRFAAAEFLLLGAPRPWTPVDSLLWGRAMGASLSGNWRTELARLSLAGRVPDAVPDAVIEALWPREAGGAGQPQAGLAPGLDPALAGVAGELAALLPVFPDPFTLPATASNEWAVDGRHSASGAPLLAGDPHLGFGLPGIWYLARIDTPAGTLAGATAPGVPFLVIGHNGHVAWTFTTTGADTQDLFIETPSGPDAYLTPDGPRPYTVRAETIHVRGAPDEVLRVRETRHGPVISDLREHANATGAESVLALAAANLEPGDPAPGLLALNRATSLAEAGRAAPLIVAPVQNMLVADRQGIGLFVTGRVPLRRAGDGSRPVAGADGRHDWTGFASGEALPRVLNPASGRLVNANERIAPADFPIPLGRDWFDDARARRIRELLDRPGPFGPAGFAAMQTDTVDMLARDLLPVLRAVTAPPGLPARALALLAAWDGTTEAGLPQPLIFNAWMQRLYLDILAGANVPPEAAAAAAPWVTLIPAALSPAGGALCGGDCRALLPGTLAEAMAGLAARFGPDPATWRWGATHQAVFANPLLRAVPLLGRASEARIGVPGDDSTLFRAGMRPPPPWGVFAAEHGAAFRGVYDLADLEHSLFVVAPGQSGHLLSPLARNFVQRWRDGAMIMIPAQPASVAARLTLTPLESR
jgi:penicillin amidase